MNTGSIAILGGGNMGRALAGGLLRQGMPAEKITVSAKSDGTRVALAQDFGIAATTDNLAAVAHAKLVIVAVKPHDVRDTLQPLAQTLQKNRATVLSVAAGIRTAALENWTGVAVVRAMPNRPALVGAGVTALFARDGVNEKERELAESAMRAVGETVWIHDEDAMDVVTALSGSGPAYYFLFTEALMQAAVELGLEKDTARRLAIGTFYGAGLMARESQAELAQLRAQVTSKGGTTEAALKSFESADFRGIVARALAAAMQRGKELAAHGNEAAKSRGDIA